MLLHLGVPTSAVHHPLAGALWLDECGGPSSASFWKSTDPSLVERQRDEFFLAGTLALAGAKLLRAVPHRNDWRLQFDVAYLCETKSLGQSIKSVDLLCSGKCYADALSVIRALHSRAARLVLFSLGPHLFDEWLHDSENKKFRDANTRHELSNHDVYVFPHFYHWFSDMVHGRLEALEEVGHFEAGLFPEIPAIENMVFVAAKLLLGIMGWTALSAAVVDQDGAPTAVADVIDIRNIYAAQFRDAALDAARFDHLWTTIPQERHAERALRDGMIDVKWFDFEDYQRRLGLFHRQEHPLQLSTNYADTTVGLE